MTSSSSPVVTVLLSSHNGEKYLRQALDSMAAQTFTDWEWVLVNDGSTDHTPDIFMEYLSRFGPRVKVLHHKIKEGLTESLNEGLAHAAGTYIARMDDDDIAHPDRLARQVGVMESDPELVLLGTAGFRLDEKTGMVGNYMPHLDPVRLRIVLCWHNPFLHSSVMYRARLFREKKLSYPREYPAAEDYAMWAVLAEEGGVAVLPEKLITYRSRLSSVTGQRRELQLNSTRRVSEWYTRQLLKGGPLASAQPNDIRLLIEDEKFPSANRIKLVKQLYLMASRTPWVNPSDARAGFLNWAIPFLDRYKLKALFHPERFRLLTACDGLALWYVIHRVLNHVKTKTACVESV